MPHVSLISSTIPPHTASSVTTHNQFKEYMEHMVDDQGSTSLKGQAIAYGFQLIATDQQTVSGNCALLSKNRQWLKAYEASLNLDYTDLVQTTNPSTWVVPGTSQQAIFKIDAANDAAYNGITPNISNYNFYWGLSNKVLFPTNVNADGTGTCELVDTTYWNPQWATFLCQLDDDHLLCFTNQATSNTGTGSNYSALFKIAMSVWNGSVDNLPVGAFAFEKKLQRWGNSSTSVGLTPAQSITRPVDLIFDSVPP